MAFVFTVETGAGVAGANAYCTLAYARDHHDGRGQLAAWDASTAVDAVTGAVALADTLTVVDHAFLTGDGPVELTGDDLPAGLAPVTDYWVVVVDANTIKLATSYANAVATIPVVVDLTDVGSGDVLLSHADFAKQRQAIVRATDYIQEVFAVRFRGYSPADDNVPQGLAWPRRQAYDDHPKVGQLCGELITGVPDVVKRACSEYALRALTIPLARDMPTGVVGSESRSTGGMSRTVSYASLTGLSSFPVADRWLASVLRPLSCSRA